MGAKHARQHPRQERLGAGQRGHVWLEGTRVGRHSRPAHVLSRLRPHFAEDREAVEARLIEPDPDRETVGEELLNQRAVEVGHLLLRHRQM